MAPAFAHDFLAGADFSHAGYFEERGVIYKDSGQPREAFTLLQNKGLNCVRFRLFTSNSAQAQANPYNSINNLEYTLPLAVRAKHAGLKVMLDFHYSDSWADPGKQTKPAEWRDLSFLELEQRIQDYSSNCVAAFRAAGATPDFVQVGNEIIGGLLWPDGRVGGRFDAAEQWSNLGRLIKAAIRGIKDAAGENAPKIMIHIDRGGDWGATQWFFDRLAAEQVEFDWIGQSYYPFWHGSFAALRTCLNNTANRYGKPVIVAETAFPWANSTNIFNIPASPEGQIHYVAELAQIVRGVPRGLGQGIIWWGTEYVRIPGGALAGFDSRSFFNHDGDILPAASHFGDLTRRPVLRAVPNGQGVTLTWNVGGAGLLFQSASKLASDADWQSLTVDPVFSGTAFNLDLPLEDHARFYRLRSR